MTAVLGTLMKPWDGSLVLRLLVVTVAGWFRQSEQLIVAYMREENRVLREQLGAEQRRLRFTDEHDAAWPCARSRSASRCCADWGRW